MLCPPKRVREACSRFVGLATLSRTRQARLVAEMGRKQTVPDMRANTVSVEDTPKAVRAGSPSSIPFVDEGWPVLTKVSIVGDPIDIAWRNLLESTQYVSDAQRTRALSGEPWNSPPGPNKAGFHIDDRRRVLAVQGGWWYRGVHALEPHAGGTMITYIVRNVAPRPTRWLAQIFQARAHRNLVAR